MWSALWRVKCECGVWQIWLYCHNMHMVMSDTRPAPGDLQFLKFHHQKYLFEQIVSQCILIYCALYKVRDSLMAQTVGKASACKCGRPGFDPRVGKIVCRRKWQPTPVLLPGKFHGWRNLIGYNPWGHKESDTTEWLHFLMVYLYNIVSSHVEMFSLILQNISFVLK